MEKTENAKMKINTLLGILLVSVITSYIIHNHVQQRNTEMQLASALERTEALEKEINLVYQEIEKIRDSIDAQNSSLQANMRRSVRQELDSIMVDSARKNKEKVLSIFSNAYDVKNDHVYGNPNARFSIYEYLDFECPYCAQFSVTAKKVADDSNGHVNVILRHYPLPMHGQEAKLKALFAECVGHLDGNRSFWYAVHALFAGKSTDGIVQNLNLNTEDIASCMSSENALADRVHSGHQTEQKTQSSWYPVRRGHRQHHCRNLTVGLFLSCVNDVFILCLSCTYIVLVLCNTCVFDLNTFHPYLLCLYLIRFTVE